jgi:hypothetical protein
LKRSPRRAAIPDLFTAHLSIIFYPFSELCRPLADFVVLWEIRAMSIRRICLSCLLFVTMGAASALAADNVAQTPVEVQPHVVKPKPAAKAPERTPKAKAAKPVGPEDSMRDVTFSDPRGPLIDGTKTPKQPAPPSTAKGAPVGPDGKGLSLDMKWHATNDYDPYDTVRHTSGPEGPGTSVLGGIKLGF